MDNRKLLEYIDILIFKDEIMDENTLDDIISVITLIFDNKRYQRMLSILDNNWLEIPTDKVIKSILYYFNSLKNIEVHN